MIKKRGIKEMLFWIFFKSPNNEQIPIVQQAISSQYEQSMEVNEYKTINEHSSAYTSQEHNILRNKPVTQQSVNGTGLLYKQEFTAYTDLNEDSGETIVPTKDSELDPQHVFCIKCGQKCKPPAKFCFKCGNLLN